MKMNGIKIVLNVPKWNVEELTGYKPITTFWQDFSIADRFGIDAIKDTFSRAFKEWKGNYKYLTELAMVLNHKTWGYYEADNHDYSELYEKLYKEIDQYACNNLHGKELEYYYEITD